MNFALLGDIAFDLLNAPSAFDERRTATFAEHAVLAGKPRLQAMGLELAEITLQLRLHHQLAPVEARYQALIQAKEKQEPLALVLGFSQFKGHFVITELSSQTLFSDGRGNPLAREVSLTLREFVGNTGKGVLGAALSVNGNSPLASLLPTRLTGFVSQTAKVVQQGVKAYRQACHTVNAVRETVITMKALAHQPALALAQLPKILPLLGEAVGGLAEITGLESDFEPLLQEIKGIEPFLSGLIELNDYLDAVQTEFKHGLKARELGEWFDAGVKTLAAAEEVAQSMTTSATQLTAWIALRGDSHT